MMAICALLTAILAVTYLQPGVEHPVFQWVCGAVGMALGWRSIGMHVGKGWYAAARAGLRASMYLAIIAIGYLGSVAMLTRSMRLRYHGPFDALTDVFGQCFDIALQLYQIDLIVALFVGGLISALAAEWASRHWS